MADLSNKSTEELSKTINDFYKKIGFANKMGNDAMIRQLRIMLDTYQAEYQMRLAKEVQSAKENPIFKDSLDVG